MSAGARVAVVILTWNRADELMRTIRHTAMLEEHPEIVVVDNGSTDGTRSMLLDRAPGVRVVALPSNIGAAARNHGALATDAEYIAFCDDDTRWVSGSLRTAADMLAAHPRIAVLSARVLVGEEGREDPACAAMADSPLGSAESPGPRLVGFMAGACVFRRSAFLQAGGYEPALFIGGEEELLALEIISRGWSIVYGRALTVRHHPSALRDSALRRRLLARNGLWVAWMRRGWHGAAARTFAILGQGFRDAQARAGCLEAFAGAAWALARRRAVPADVEAACRVVERHNARRARRRWLRKPGA